MGALHLLASLLLCGCGGTARAGLAAELDPADAGADGDGVSDAAEDPLSRQAAAVYCEKQFDCYPTAAAYGYSDVDACTDQVQAQLEAILAAPGVTYGAADWLACELARSSLSCTDLLLSRHYGAPELPECDMPPGTMADGLPCMFDEQCQSEQCVLKNGVGCGICRAGVGAGQLCSEGVPCAEGLVCRNTSSSSAENRCTQVAAIGEPCSDDTLCIHESPCSEGVCPPPALGKEGAPCGPQLLSWQCYPGYDCDQDAGTCKALDVPAGIGEACVEYSYGPWCKGGAVCRDSVCVPSLPWGSPCKDLSANCLYPARCISGLCQLPSAEQCL
jgi:hypothetical protein